MPDKSASRTARGGVANQRSRLGRWWGIPMIIAAVILLAVAQYLGSQSPYETLAGFSGVVLLSIGLGLLSDFAATTAQVKQAVGWLQNGGPGLIVTLVATIGVAVGFGDQPYDYYLLLRLLLCGASLYLLLGANLNLVDWERWLLGGVAVLYNPVLPIRIGEKGIWEVLNVATLALFWLVTISSRRRS